VEGWVSLTETLVLLAPLLQARAGAHEARVDQSNSI